MDSEKSGVNVNMNGIYESETDEYGHFYVMWYIHTVFQVDVFFLVCLRSHTVENMNITNVLLYVSDVLNPGERFIVSDNPDATFPFNKWPFSLLKNTLEEVKALVPKHK